MSSGNGTQRATTPVEGGADPSARGSGRPKHEAGRCGADTLLPGTCRRRSPFGRRGRARDAGAHNKRADTWVRPYKIIERN
ncbi:MAG: hypothetical protein A2W25_03115 [candidate division Zixibacteria bacterium RBG_16_53_22]|nr:MAG: hypothetical protein A2W25_03115 [candidate division Zixibacteria bacterium RBG_16_53_22]